MTTKFETEHENITFSFTTAEQHFNTSFMWGDVRVVTPWHQVYYKVNIKVYDENTNWISRNVFYIPLSDWESKEIIRGAVLPIIYKHVKFPEVIDGKKSAQVFHDSIRELNKQIRDFYSEENYDGIVG